MGKVASARKAVYVRWLIWEKKDQNSVNGVIENHHHTRILT